MAQQNPAPVATSPDRLVEYISVTSAGLQKAASLERQVEKTAAEVDGLLPQVLDVLEQFGRILPSEREKTAKALKDPAEALRFMLKLAGHRNADEMAKLGSAAGPATAPTSQFPPRNHPGMRTGQMKESDYKWFKHLGITIGAR